MKVFDSENVRNVVIAGHGDTGKTSIVSAMLYTSGAVNRLGKVDDGTTVTDYEDDEIRRKITINAALAHCEWKGQKINILDTPGYRAFILDAKACMKAAETALITIDALGGVEVQTERVWRFAKDFKVARILVINKLDRDNSNFSRTLSGLETAFGREVVPIQIPIGKEQDFKGVVDLVANKAYVYKTDESGKFEETEIPDDLQQEAQDRREQLIEMIAESDDDLMEKFFDSGTLSDVDLKAGLKNSIRDRQIFPVICLSAGKNIGTAHLLDNIVELCPSPLERAPVAALSSSGEEEEFEINPDGPAAAFVFKTLADPFAGRISLLKVYGGKLKSDSSVRNISTQSNERLGTLQIFQGKNHEAIPEVSTGDICGALKLKETTSGNTLGDSKLDFKFKQIDYPDPAISFAIEPASRGDEEKIGSAVSRIMEEDPSLRFTRDQQTKEFLLSGSGQLHIEVSVAKLKKKYGVEVILKPPKVPYRETITGKADVQGRHKKQTGGHGQFGDCKIRMEPLPRGGGFEFVDEIFGGAIPRQFIPAVEKGIQAAAGLGYLAGYPVVDFRVTLYDGSYHDVDSSEMAFKIAGSLAFKKGMQQARAVLLEPIMDIEVYAPEESAGDIMGDLNSRRGRIQGMDVKGTNQVIRARVPMSEVLNYQPALTSMTGGRGSFTIELSHYDIVPHNIAEKLIAEVNRDGDD